MLTGLECSSLQWKTVRDNVTFNVIWQWNAVECTVFVGKKTKSSNY